MSSYCEIQVRLDHDQFEEFPNGVRVQEIELIFTDDPERPAWRSAEPAVCALDARRARMLACQLLQAAESVEYWEKTR